MHRVCEDSSGRANPTHGTEWIVHAQPTQPADHFLYLFLFQLPPAREWELEEKENKLQMPRWFVGRT